MCTQHCPDLSLSHSYINVSSLFSLHTLASFTNHKPLCILISLSNSLPFKLQNEGISPSFCSVCVAAVVPLLFGYELNIWRSVVEAVSSSQVEMNAIWFLLCNTNGWVSVCASLRIMENSLKKDLPWLLILFWTVMSIIGYISTENESYFTILCTQCLKH